MNKLLIILSIIAITSSAHAEYLGCFEPNEAVEVKTLYLDSTGARVDPTSPGCEIYDPNDTTATSCTSGPTKVGSITGWYESSHTVPASPLEGVWYAKTHGTISSVVKEGLDSFYVVDVTGECAGRSGVLLKSATHTGAVIPTVTAVTNDVGITQAGADKVWGTTVRAITDIPAGAIGLSEIGSTNGSVTTGSCDPNTTLTFDTTMTEAGVNHWKDSFLTFKDDTTTTELRGQTKAITASAVNGCITVKGGFTTTPQSGDTFVIINK